ncbi:ABC transporter permease subunit [Streptomyces sp. NP-1717]|uniref:ABC transporter permease subunit n=1 Tax=unclassified Streptomyces TaxID=2593676 RepID=UPI001F5C400E|nr:ABC transporter permease subunit [Streptomyces sp. NP-1717]MCI3225040.1 ABC transporter permease subunit [Streptomyces sp. NP-1717]WTA75802.1 ABC transporter permease subunit [Streptomyces sp. NBC_00838]
MTAPHEQQAPIWQGGQPLGSYTSPIPVRPATFGDALASEWTKIRSVRSTMWTLGVMIVLMVGVGGLAAWAVSLSEADLGAESALPLGFFGALLSSICVITLGVLTIASEYGTGMIRTTLTACPSRGRVLAAKSLVFFLLVLTITTVTAALVGGVQVALLDGRAPTGQEWLQATLGVGLYLALLGLMSLGVGALIRHSAGAITIMIGVVLLPLVLAMFMFSSSLVDVQQALFEYSIPSQIAVLYDTSMTGSGPSGWDPLFIGTAVSAVVMAFAFFSLDRRDV